MEPYHQAIGTNMKIAHLRSWGRWLNSKQPTSSKWGLARNRWSPGYLPININKARASLYDREMKSC